MYALKSQDQGLITLSQQDYLPIMVEIFPDRPQVARAISRNH